MAGGVIPLQAMRDALMMAKIKKVLRVSPKGEPLGRVAAYTYYAPFTSVTCRHNWRHGQRRTFPGMHFGPLDRGDLWRLLERVRCSNGLAEVRRTWGAGMRALQAEFADGVLR